MSKNSFRNFLHNEELALVIDSEKLNRCNFNKYFDKENNKKIQNFRFEYNLQFSPKISNTYNSILTDYYQLSILNNKLIPTKAFIDINLNSMIQLSNKKVLK